MMAPQMGETVPRDLDCDKSETTSTDTSNSNFNKETTAPDEVSGCQISERGLQDMSTVVMVSDLP